MIVYTLPGYGSYRIIMARVFPDKRGYHGHGFYHGDMIPGTGLIEHGGKAWDFLFQVVPGRAGL